jgi:hypothetical protein
MQFLTCLHVNNNVKNEDHELYPMDTINTFNIRYFSKYIFRLPNMCNQYNQHIKIINPICCVNSEKTGTYINGYPLWFLPIKLNKIMQGVGIACVTDYYLHNNFTWKYGLHADSIILCAFKNCPWQDNVTSTRFSLLNCSKNTWKIGEQCWYSFTCLQFISGSLNCTSNCLNNYTNIYNNIVQWLLTDKLEMMKGSICGLVFCKWCATTRFQVCSECL